MKRFTICWLCLLGIASILCINLTAATDDPVTFTFDESSGHMRIEGDGEAMWEAQKWEPYCEKIIHVTIGDRITGLGGPMFRNCINLNSINSNTPGEAILPDSIVEIGYRAFSNCKSLQTVRFGKGLVLISGECFNDCTGLEEILFPDSLKSIHGAFSGCEQLKEVHLPDGLEALAGFSGCDSLETVTIPGSIRLLKGGFTSCIKLQTVIFEEGIQRIPNGTLNLSGVKRVFLPKSLRVVELGALSGSSIQDVYYAGTEEEWANVNLERWIDADPGINTLSQNVRIHYQCIPDDVYQQPVPNDTEPPGNGNNQTPQPANKPNPILFGVTGILTAGIVAETAWLLIVHFKRRRFHET